MNIPLLTPGNLLAHITLTHNFVYEWITSLNPPFWSIALEWQIYFVFALVLLPLWRRAGAVATVGAAFLLGCLPSLFGFQFMSAWYLGLFALGMAAAEISFGTSESSKRFEQARHGGKILLSCAGVALFSILIKGNQASPLRIAQDASIGFAMFFALIECTKLTRTQGEQSPVIRMLTNPVSHFLGRMSYSLYLIHYPLLALIVMGLTSLHISHSLMFAGMVALGLPIVGALAYLFYWCFERPFVQSAAKPRPAETILATK